LIPVGVIEFDGGQFIDHGFASRPIFNERLAGFIGWTFTTNWRQAGEPMINILNSVRAHFSP